MYRVYLGTRNNPVLNDPLYFQIPPPPRGTLKLILAHPRYVKIERTPGSIYLPSPISMRIHTKSNVYVLVGLD